MNQPMTENEKNSMLMKGIVIGGMIGGVLSLIDAKTRTQLKETAVDLKSTSQKMLSDVKENPNEMKDQMVSQFTQVTNVLKEAISDAQKLYERLNEDLFSKMGDIKEVSSGALSTVKDAKDDLKQIGSKIVDAGSELKGITSVSSSGSDSSTEEDSSSSSSQMNSDASSEVSGSEQQTSNNSQTDASGNSSAKIESFGNDSILAPNDEIGQVGSLSKSANQSEASASNASSKGQDKSAGVQYNNKKGQHTYGGQETPNRRR